MAQASPGIDTLIGVELLTRDGCRPGIGRYPDFAYTAQGATAYGHRRPREVTAAPHAVHHKLPRDLAAAASFVRARRSPTPVARGHLRELIARKDLRLLDWAEWVA
ncbi:unnamed protein product [Urochloa humidicola]